MMGDFHAKISSDNRGYEEVMEKHVLREVSNSGERFTILYALKKLVIGRSVYQHVRIHEAAMVLPSLLIEKHIIMSA